MDTVREVETPLTSLAIEDLLATARSDLLRETVNLSVVLGGGWDTQSETVASRQAVTANP
ncbi:MAG: hypothetical protein EA423_01260 [Phycisphaerales bacterium]|nr:MAG: hypothetical protein EA423_01260 [Phycisphaerales bacterium]